MVVRLPHPIVLLAATVALAAAFTWILPAGEYQRREDPATGRTVVVAGTYQRVAPSPVGPFAAAVAIPRGFVAAADVVAVILFVGGAWVLIDELGVLPAIIGAIVRRFTRANGRRGASASGRAPLWVIPIIALFFAVMGALENMQEEIIPLIPALMVLGAGLGVDGVIVVAMSAGAAMVGSAFGPSNPFQAGIAMKLAELPPLEGAGLRLAMFVAAFVVWVGWTMRYAARNRTLPRQTKPAVPGSLPARIPLIFAIIVSPMAFYVYGALELGWGFNELSAAFLIAAIVAGLVGGLGIERTATSYVNGMLGLLPAALMVGLARSVSLVLADGRIMDTILAALVGALGRMPAGAAAVLMVPVHALIHVGIPSVSGHAVLTMPLFVPLADVLGFSRQVPVLAYQTGAGLMEMVTPTNGALMAVLLGAGVPLQHWLRFALGGLVLLVLVGLVGMAFAYR